MVFCGTNLGDLTLLLVEREAQNVKDSSFKIVSILVETGANKIICAQYYSIAYDDGSGVVVLALVTRYGLLVLLI